MKTNMYTFTVPLFIQSLRALHEILIKGEVYATEKSTSFLNAPEQLLLDRLTFDQFPLWLQIQLACENAVNGTASLSGKKAIEMPRTAKTFPELVVRIDESVKFLESLVPEDFDGAESRSVTIPSVAGRMADGLAYAQHFLIPNFYFHMTTAYAVLRKDGLDLGKRDFIGSPSPFK